MRFDTSTHSRGWSMISIPILIGSMSPPALFFRTPVSHQGAGGPWDVGLTCDRRDAAQLGPDHVARLPMRYGGPAHGREPLEAPDSWAKSTPPSGGEDDSCVSYRRFDRWYRSFEQRRPLVASAIVAASITIGTFVGIALVGPPRSQQSATTVWWLGLTFVVACIPARFSIWYRVSRARRAADRRTQ